MNLLMLTLLFVASFLLTLLTPLFLPLVKLSFFTPFLISLIYRKTVRSALFFSLMIGVVLDLLSAHTPIGFWALNSLIASALVIQLKPFFFEDKWPSYPLLTFIFSFISTISYLLVYNLFFPKLHLSINWILTDLILYPAFDALYALVVFVPLLRALSTWLPQRRKTTRSFRLNSENSSI